jgi:MFS family permease
VPSLVIFGGAFASLSLLTPSLWHLYAIFFVLGVVGHGTAQMAYTRAVSSWFTTRRGMALAIVMAGGAIGSMLLPPFAETLVRDIGWRAACVTLGAMVLGLGLPVVAAFVRQRPLAARETGFDGSASLRDGLTSRVLGILVVGLLFSSVAQNGALTHMAALLTDRGVPSTAAALAVSAMGAASLAGRLVTGWLLDRFFAGRVAFVMLSMAALGTLLLATAQSTTTGIIAASLIGLGMGSEADVTPYILSRYFGLQSFSTLYGFTYSAYAFAGALGPVLMGRAFDATGSYTMLLTELALGTFAVAALMLLMPRLAVRPPAHTAAALEFDQRNRRA